MSYWKDKIVIVTGGTRGLGRAIAQSFAKAGSHVVVASRDAAAVARVEAELQATGQSALGIAADITRDEDVARLVQSTIDRFGRLDVLVNNAGRSVRGAVMDTTPDQFRDLMELNLLSLVRCTRAAVPHLLKQRGHVVNIGSLASKTASLWVGAYPATKHAVAAYSQQLRLELGPQGLHVLLVCPGPIASDEPRRQPMEGADSVPEAARRPGAGVHLNAIPPERLAELILRACRRRSPELIVPGYVRLLFALAQLWPSLGDWIVRKKT